MIKVLNSMPRRLVAAAAATIAIAGLVMPVQPAAAGDAGAVAAGIIGGAAVGALVAGAVRPAPPPVVYDAPPPRVVYRSAPPVEYVEPECHWRRERVWDGYDWHFRRVRVCD
jgi:hypothetical protein